MRGGEHTLETRTRFFPLVRDDEWGARLHRADLAVNKVIAASTRTKARDYVDLLMIDTRMCPLGPVIMAAAGKPPHFSPLRMIEEIRRRALSVANEAYTTVRGLPSGWTPARIRDEVVAALNRAENYLRNAPPELVGILAVNSAGIPMEVHDLNAAGIEYREATSEPEVSPELPETASRWGDAV